MSKKISQTIYNAFKADLDIGINQIPFVRSAVTYKSHSVAEYNDDNGEQFTVYGSPEPVLYTTIEDYVEIGSDVTGIVYKGRVDLWHNDYMGDNSSMFTIPKYTHDEAINGANGIYIKHPIPRYGFIGEYTKNGVMYRVEGVCTGVDHREYWHEGLIGMPGAIPGYYVLPFFCVKYDTCGDFRSSTNTLFGQQKYYYTFPSYIVENYRYNTYTVDFLDPNSCYSYSIYGKLYSFTEGKWKYINTGYHDFVSMNYVTNSMHPHESPDSIQKEEFTGIDHYLPTWGDFPTVWIDFPNTYSEAGGFGYYIRLMGSNFHYGGSDIINGHRCQTLRLLPYSRNLGTITMNRNHNFPNNNNKIEGVDCEYTEQIDTSHQQRCFFKTSKDWEDNNHPEKQKFCLHINERIFKLYPDTPLKPSLKDEIFAVKQTDSAVYDYQPLLHWTNDHEAAEPYIPLAAISEYTEAQLRVNYVNPKGQNEIRNYKR